MKKETIRTIFFTVIIIIGSVWFIRFFIIEPYRITPGQMENSLLPGDRLWSISGRFGGEPETRNTEMSWYSNYPKSLKPNRV